MYVHLQKLKIVPIALLEQEVVLNELLSGGFVHALQWVVCALQFAFEAFQGRGDELLEPTYTKSITHKGRS